MVDLFVYDGRPIVRDRYLNRTQKEEELQKVFREVMGLLNPAPPEDLLIRTVVDYNRDNFGGISTFLTNCMSNGHDRASDSEWGTIIGESQEDLIQKGYAAKEVIWATPEIRDKDPKPYSWSGASNGTNICLLIIDKCAYKEELYTIYAQKDSNTRKKGLRGILLFDMNKECAEGRNKLHAHYTSLKNVKHVVNEINRAGYFTK